MVRIRLVQKRVVDFLLVLIEHFSLALTVEALRADIGRNRCVRRGVTHQANFRGNGASHTNDCWRQKTRVTGLSYGVGCMILSLVILVGHQLVTDGETDGHTHDDGKFCASIASRG